MLKSLCNLCGASGYENEVINFITNKLREENIAYTVDKIGNIVVRQGDTPDDLGIFAHIDEVAFGVKGITEEGMIKFESIGGILENILPSHSVVVGKEKIKGVIGNIPPHLKKKSKENSLSYNDFFIDIGAKSKEDAKKYVKVGDPIYWISEYVEFGDNLIKAKALDDRAGVSILLSLVLLKKYSFTAVFTTREELGVIGAKTVLKSNKQLNLKNALVLEVTTCADMPDVPEKTTVLGNGVAISVMDRGSVADSEFNEEIIRIAKKSKLAYQKKLTLSGGNDAGAITYFSGGIPTAVLSLPGRYIHSPVTVISKNDYFSAEKLCKKILEERNNK